MYRRGYKKTPHANVAKNYQLKSWNIVLLLAYFFFIFVFLIQLKVNKICQWQNLKCRSLVLEATALPTAPQPLPIRANCYIKDHHLDSSRFQSDLGRCLDLRIPPQTPAKVEKQRRWILEDHLASSPPRTLKDETFSSFLSYYKMDHHQPLLN